MQIMQLYRTLSSQTNPPAANRLETVNTDVRPEITPKVTCCTDSQLHTTGFTLKVMQMVLQLLYCRSYRPVKQSTVLYSSQWISKVPHTK